MVFVLCLVSDAGLPDNVGRLLTDAEKEEVISRNSPLIDYIYLSPNANFPREDAIEKITIHHMAGDSLTATGRFPLIMPLTAAGKWLCMWRKPTGRGLQAAGKTITWR